MVTFDLPDNSLTGTDVQTSCDSYTWIDGITYTSSNNTATTVLLTASGGCDSLVTFDLTIGTSNTGIDLQTACDSTLGLMAIPTLRITTVLPGH